MDFSLENLLEVIAETEDQMEEPLPVFWQLLKNKPEKWDEKHYAETTGFWVVAICGKKIIFFNNIEGGFTISEYSEYGKIGRYTCEDYELNQVVWQLYNVKPSQ